jgi:glycosyltransferase involved in cell wall biosynthesis
LVALYQRCDVFCLPTRGDCLPMVLSEAGATGLPLVSTDVGAIGEIVRDGESGRLVPVDDADRLTAVLTELVEDAALRRRLGDGAAALVGREFDAERNAQRLLDLLVDVARTSAGSR